MDKAAIFDFNGTLFWDTDINYISWDNCLKRWLGISYSKELYAKLNGRTNPETLEYLYGKKLDKNFLEDKCNEKNNEYLKVLENQRAEVSLASGVESFFESLIEANVSIAIATSAPPELMVEYEKFFKLSRFFEAKNIISNDGSIASKPNPAIYEKAIKVLDVKPSSCVVFEDTKSGILSAYRANVNKVIAIESDGADTKTINSMNEVSFSLKDFNNINIDDLF